MMGLPAIHLAPYMVAPTQAFPYRSAQLGYGPWMSSSNPTTLMSDVSYLNNQINAKVDKAGMVERAAHSRDLELRIIMQTLKRSKEQQVDEIDKSFKWEIDTLRQELTSEAEGKIA